MNAKQTGLMALLTAVSLTAPLAATAQQRQRPPEPPISEMASDMGVSEKALRGCMPGGGQKAQQSGKQQSRPERPDPADIASCLTGKGDKVSQSKVAKTLAKYGPKERS